MIHNLHGSKSGIMEISELAHILTNCVNYFCRSLYIYLETHNEEKLVFFFFF